MTRPGRTPGSVLICALILFSNAGDTEILKWVDEQGKVHYGDQRPGNVGVDVLDVKISSYEQVDITSSQPLKVEQVVMYSTSWCGYCKQARNYFAVNDIDYVEYDIEKDRSARGAYKRLSARGVPVILVGKQRMNGFSVTGFRQIYSRAD